MDETGVFGCIATVLSVITIWQTYRASKLAKEVAIHQGAFKKPNLQISLYGESKVKEFIFALPLKDNRIFEIPLGYEILNSGESSAKEIELYVRTSKDLRYGGKGRLNLSGEIHKEVKVVLMAETEHMQTYVTTFNSIHPNQSLIISDPVTISSSTIIETDVPVKTKDNVGLIISYKLEYAYEIDFMITQLDYAPITKRFRIAVVDISHKSIKEYFDDYNQSCLKEYRKLKAKESFKDKVQRFFGKKSFIRELKLITVDESKLTIKEDTGFYTLPKGATYKSDGLRTELGFFIPAKDVYWPK